jgi:hypothetical protein
MMLSATYQQSSQASAERLKADPENRLLGRMNRKRLEAEAIRDALLAVAGGLDSKSGGPAESDPSCPRRTLYLKTSRSNRSGLGPLFDAANPAMHVERRTASTVAPQSLLLMNEPLTGDAAARVVERAEIAAETDSPQRIEKLYELIFARSPTASEIEMGRQFIEGATADPFDQTAGTSEPVEPWAVYTHALLLSNEFLFVD